MKRIEPYRLYSWASILEEVALQQAKSSAMMPFIFPHVAIMPDAHWGKGATIGSVIPTLHAIIPAAVGVDLGCGMMAVRTQFDVDEFRAHGHLSDLRMMIESLIPLGKGAYNQSYESQPRLQARIEELQDMRGYFQASSISPEWRHQLGSLGGGNHFIEVSRDDMGRIWLFLHSGSRGVGNRLANQYIKAARAWCEKIHVLKYLPDPDLAYFVEGERDFTDYIEAVNWAQRFAFLNRAEMMDRVELAVSEWYGADVIRTQEINCHHNYAQIEHQWGRDVWVTRKGAIRARQEDYGLIPGSMGTASYVVAGKGNKLSLDSAPHGAGRLMSRGMANKQFTQNQLADAMAGIEWHVGGNFLDEHPGAYKDIDQVMFDAADLVEPVHALYQLVNVKGELWT